ncbi:MAG: VOC family protein [Dehalococcoidia bacterium]
MIRIKRLDHYGLNVSNLSRAEAFYSETLGMDIESKMGHMTLLKGGNAVLALFENPKIVPGDTEDIKDPLGKAHHAFEVSREDFQRALERFPQENIPLKGPIDWGDHDCLYFLDPDGNLLELISNR